MSNQSRKHRGYATQRIVADYLKDNGWPFAESTGAGRQGSDITGTPCIDWEVKARRGFDPTSAIKQLSERYNGKDLPIAVLRPDGYGPARIAEWPAILPLAALVQLLKEAGYGSDNT
jgi:hypothetical protein